MFSFLVSCGDDSETGNDPKTETEAGACANVKKAECLPYDDFDAQVEEVESCENSHGSSCEVVTEGSGECETSVMCLYSGGSCNNSFVACPDGYEMSEYESECTVGEDGCIESEKGICTQAGTCELIPE